MWWRKSRTELELEDLDERCSRAWQRDSDYRHGYVMGYYAALKYEHDVRNWVQGGGNGPMPEYNPDPPRTECKRLQKHLEREHRRLARDLR
jgi:hypothetical protein